MAAITKLPAELVYQILNSFEDHKTTLCRLSLVSSFFVSVAQQLLLRHLVLSVDISLNGIKTPFDKIVKKFDQTPRLSAHVLTLVLSSRHQCNESLDSIKRALDLLNRVTSLQSLDLKNALMLPRWDISPPTSGFFLETNHLTRLTKLKLRSPWISWSGLVTLLYLPNLEHLSLDYLPDDFASPTFENIQGRICAIRSLELGTWQAQLGLPLKRLLEMTTRLEEFMLRMGPEISSSRHSYNSSEISQAMVPVHDTLKVFSISGVDSYDTQPVSPLNLSGFRVLEKVEVLSSLYFASRDAERWRVGQYKLLPRSLLDLQINFVGEARIISIMDPTPSVLEHWQVKWLSELAVNKSTHYPNFRSLILREWHSQRLGRSHDHFDKTNCHQVGLPEGLKLKFETNSIAFQGWARR